MIKIKNLTYHYDLNQTPVIAELSLEIKTNEYVALVGPNGSGKTTLIRHLNGLLLPNKGDIWIDDLNTKEPALLPQIRQKVGMVFQNPDHQIVGTTVEEDVAFGPGNLNLSPSEIRQRVDQALEQVGLSRHLKSASHALSGGEKQLLALAGVLAMQPSYVAFDEPTSHLDPLARKNILQVLMDLNGRGMTIIHVTHNMDEIIQAGRILVMDQGKLILDGTPAAVFSHMEWLQKIGLDVPKINALVLHLRRMGLELRADILDLDEACRELYRLIKPDHSNEVQISKV
ncbi:MAG: energy-coupling factor transporter ATPase [Desulfobacteraceae bacterium]|nr:MAG: energy-coupling factor transporter ATPase [Desulfobacteraceae bacterium]